MLTSIHNLRHIEHFLNSRRDNSTILDYRITLRLNLDIDISLLSKNSDNTILSELKNQINTQKLHAELVNQSDLQTDEFYDYLFSQNKNPNLINLVNRRRDDYLTHYEI